MPDLGWGIRAVAISRIETEVTTSRRKTTKPDLLVVAGRDVPLVVEGRRARWTELRAVLVGDSSAIGEYLDTDAEVGRCRDLGTSSSFGHRRMGLDGSCIGRVGEMDEERKQRC